MQREGASKTVDVKPANNWPSRGKIEFKSVQMRYREELPFVLVGVTFSVKAGEKIGNEYKIVELCVHYIIFLCG